jgi:hypothetical protein
LFIAHFLAREELGDLTRRIEAIEEWLIRYAT